MVVHLLTPHRIAHGLWLLSSVSNKPYILSILSYMHVIYENIHKRVFCCTRRRWVTGSKGWAARAGARSALARCKTTSRSSALRAQSARRPRGSPAADGSNSFHQHSASLGPSADQASLRPGCSTPSMSCHRSPAFDGAGRARVCVSVALWQRCAAGKCANNNGGPSPSQHFESQLVAHSSDRDRPTQRSIERFTEY